MSNINRILEAAIINLDLHRAIKSLEYKAAADAAKWVTVGGGENITTGEKSGRHFQIDTETGRILKGGSPAMKGKTFDQAFNDPSTLTERQKVGRKISAAGAEKHGGTEREYRNLGTKKGQSDYFANQYLKNQLLPSDVQAQEDDKNWHSLSHDEKINALIDKAGMNKKDAEKVANYQTTSPFRNDGTHLDDAVTGEIPEGHLSAALKSPYERMQDGELKPYSTEGFKEVLKNPSLLEYHRDELENHFQERAIGIYNDLLSKGWEKGDRHGELTKGNYQLKLSASARGVQNTLVDKTKGEWIDTEQDSEKDYVEKTPAEFADMIDSHAYSTAQDKPTTEAEFKQSAEPTAEQLDEQKTTLLRSKRFEIEDLTDENSEVFKFNEQIKKQAEQAISPTDKGTIEARRISKRDIYGFQDQQPQKSKQETYAAINQYVDNVKRPINEKAVIKEIGNYFHGKNRATADVESEIKPLFPDLSTKELKTILTAAQQSRAYKEFFDYNQAVNIDSVSFGGDVPSQKSIDLYSAKASDPKKAQAENPRYTKQDMKAVMKMAKEKYQDVKWDENEGEKVKNDLIRLAGDFDEDTYNRLRAKGILDGIEYSQPSAKAQAKQMTNIAKRDRAVEPVAIEQPIPPNPALDGLRELARDFGGGESVNMTTQPSLQQQYETARSEHKRLESSLYSATSAAERDAIIDQSKQSAQKLNQLEKQLWAEKHASSIPSEPQPYKTIGVNGIGQVLVVNGAAKKFVRTADAEKALESLGIKGKVVSRGSVKYAVPDVANKDSELMTKKKEANQAVKSAQQAKIDKEQKDRDYRASFKPISGNTFAIKDDLREKFNAKFNGTTKQWEVPPENYEAAKSFAESHFSAPKPQDIPSSSNSPVKKPYGMATSYEDSEDGTYWNGHSIVYG